MDRIRLSEIYEDSEKYLDKEIFIEGWAKNIRVSSNVIFININDGSCFKDLQLVISKENKSFEEIKTLTIYSSISVKGKLVKSSGSQEFEVQVEDIFVFQRSFEDYPLQNKRHTREFLREIAHLRPRANLFKAVFRLRSLAAFAIHSFFQGKGFIYVNTPLITSSDAEGAGEMFTLSEISLKELSKLGDKYDPKETFFGKEAHLTVSGQLNGEAYAHAFGDIYTFGPTFRAEKSHTTKHAAEFWMMEPEMAFTDLDGCIENIEEMIKYVLAYIFNHGKDELEFLNKFVQPGLIDKLTKAKDEEFGRCTYTEAIEILKKADKKFEYKVDWGIDLQTEHETYLAEEVFKKPVFVTDYPKDIKAFYMKLNSDGKTVAAVDLLVPSIGELVGGSQREEDYDVLVEKIKENGLKVEDYSWYLDFRKYGSVVHSGYGLGFERFIMYITGVENIRDVIPFPRTPNNCEF